MPGSWRKEKGTRLRVFSPVKTSVEEYLEILVCAHSFNFCSFDDNWVRLCSVLSESIIFSFVFPTLSSRILSSHHRTQSVCCIMSVTIVYNLSNPCSIISKPASLVFIMSAPAVGSIDKVWDASPLGFPVRGCLDDFLWWYFVRYYILTFCQPLCQPHGVNVLSTTLSTTRD